MDLYGYELLYRQSPENFFAGIDDDQATKEVIYNAFLVVGLDDLTDGTKAFINFSKDLIDSDVPYLLPPESTVIEVIERKEVTQYSIDACKKLRSKGYKIAIDDFDLDENSLELIKVADIIKIEYPNVSFETQRSLIRKYKHKVKFIAEKIETREDYQEAKELGYDLFQGYFFSKPAIINSKDIELLDKNILRIIEELNQTEPSYKVISDIIEGDLGLSYKLLKLANSVFFTTRNEIKSISHALSYLGVNELYQWFSLMMIKNIQDIENAEMIKLSLIRGKLMSLLASELKINDDAYFLTGIFSFIDKLLNKNMEQVLEGIPLSTPVKQALLGADNEYRRVLNCVIDFEMANWDKTENQYLNIIGTNRFMQLYLESLKWARKLNY